MNSFLLRALVLCAALLSTGCGSMMVHESESPFGFDKTVTAIMDNIEAAGWSSPKVYDMQKMLLEKGQRDVGRMKVVKLCNPDYAASLLAADDSKFVGVMMPCSFAVYEKSDGKTYVSTMNMKLMSYLFAGNIGDLLGKVAAADDEILGFLQND